MKKQINIAKCFKRGKTWYFTINGKVVVRGTTRRGIVEAAKTTLRVGWSDYTLEIEKTR